MNALLILIPITLVLAALAVGVFFWAVRHDQFEDLDTPKILPLLDEPPENRGQSALSRTKPRRNRGRCPKVHSDPGSPGTPPSR